MIHKYVQQSILAPDHICISTYTLTHFSSQGQGSSGSGSSGSFGAQNDSTSTSFSSFSRERSNSSHSQHRDSFRDSQRDLPTFSSLKESNLSNISSMGNGEYGIGIGIGIGNGINQQQSSGMNTTGTGSSTGIGSLNKSQKNQSNNQNQSIQGNQSGQSNLSGGISHMCLFSNATQKKYALMLLSNELNAVNIIPIENPCTLKITSENEFALFLRKQSPKMYTFGMASGELWNCVSTLGSAISFLIQESSLESVETSRNEVSDYSWLQHYEYLISVTPSSFQLDGNQDSRLIQDSIMPSTSNTSSSTRTSQLPLSPRRATTSMTDLKDQWISSQMINRRSEFTEQIQMSVLLGTFNVNMKTAREEDKIAIQKWLQIRTSDQVSQARYPDILFIGLQEVDMSATAVLKEQTESRIFWDQTLKSILNTKTDNNNNSENKLNYVLVNSRQLVGIYSALFINQKYNKPDILKEIYNSVEGVGVMGLGNKGAVGIRMEIHKTTFCFINAHLSPHKSNVERRNQNYSDILKRMTFNDRKYLPENHDYLFWIGDLNYRVNMEYAEAIQSVKMQDYKTLIQNDQLIIEKAKNEAFQIFDEAEINFPCTFRYNVGTDIFDTSEKKRVPSYTDRILWKKNDAIKNLNYTSFNEVRLSDHKPVSALFEVPVQVVIKEKYKKIQNEVIKTLDKMENEMLPEIKLSQTDFHFGAVRFEEVKTQKLIVENVGKVVCKFCFVPKPNEEFICKDWLEFEPSAGILLPEEKMVINISINVRMESGHALNSERDTLDDILILHLQNGRDHFLCIQGDWTPTCFANSIERISKLKYSIRSPGKHQYIVEPEKRLFVPKELFTLCKYLYDNGLDESRIFSSKASNEERHQICEILDTGEPITNYKGSCDAIAEAIVSLLRNFEEPVIPYRYFDNVLNAAESLEKSLEVIRSIEEAIHFNIFVYLISFLREVLKHSHKNDITEDRLAIVFAEAMIRKKERVPTQLELSLMSRFVRQFLDPNIEPDFGHFRTFK